MSLVLADAVAPVWTELRTLQDQARRTREDTQQEMRKLGDGAAAGSAQSGTEQFIADQLQRVHGLEGFGHRPGLLTGCGGTKGAARPPWASRGHRIP